MNWMASYSLTKIYRQESGCQLLNLRHLSQVIGKHKQLRDAVLYSSFDDSDLCD